MAKTYKKKENPDKEVDLISIEMGKKPPQAVDIEEAVLGALMLEPDAVADVVDTLVPECFYKESNRKIFSAIVSLATRHAP